MLARFYELLDQHMALVRSRFNEFHQQDYHDELMQTLERDCGIHLPNIFNFNYIYKFIKAEIDSLEESCSELLDKVTQLCMNTAGFFINAHFSRFKKVSDAITERCRDEFDAIHAQTGSELHEMLAAEKSHHYLSTSSENEYQYVLNLLTQNPDLNRSKINLRLLSLTPCDSFYNGESRFESSIRTIKNSVHAYWLQLTNRFISQFHMWLLHNFVHQFRDSFHRKVDQEFAPNSGTDLGEDVKQWMEEPY